MHIRLISWNLHGPPLAPRRRERMGAAAAEMARRAPDLIVLQEVWFPADAAHLVEQLGSNYEPIDVASGGLFGRKGGLLAFLRTSSPWLRTTEGQAARFEPFRVAASPWIFWQGDGLGGKGVQVIELRHRDSAQQLCVLNTHLQAQYKQDGYKRVRRAQIDQLTVVARSVDSSMPVLAAGDLNTRPLERLYGQLTRAWEDLSADLRQKCACGTAVRADGAGTGNAWIDYVLAHRRTAWKFTAQVDRIRNRGVDQPFSDHDGLDALIDVSKTESASLSRRALAALVLHGPSSRRAWLSAATVLLLDGVVSLRAERAPDTLAHTADRHLPAFFEWMKHILYGGNQS